MSNDKFLEAAQADYEALYRDQDMIEYLADLYRLLHALDPTHHDINSHWLFNEELTE
jgi:hypothetical protein